MSETFDPYYTWLGIPPPEQPPHHYRLLGIAVFESSPTVIENAADRLMVDIRSRSIGSNGQRAQSLLNEIANARACLLNPTQKIDYDMELHKEQSRSIQPPSTTDDLVPPRGGGVAAAQDSEIVAAPQYTPHPNPRPFVPRRRQRKRPRDQNTTVRLILIAGGGVVGIVFALFLLNQIRTQERERAASAARRNTQLRQQKNRSFPTRPQTRQRPRSTPELPATPGKKEQATSTPEPTVDTPEKRTAVTPGEREKLAELFSTQPQPQQEEQRPNVAQLREQLSNADPDKRVEAASALAKIGGEASQAVTELVQALDDVFPEVQNSAMKALAAIGDDAEAAIKPLYNKVLNTTDDEQRGEMVRTITSIDPTCKELRLIVEKAIEGVSGTDIESTNKILLANRLWACNHITTLGPEADWAGPTLRRLLRATGQRLGVKGNIDVFESCVNALVAIKADDSSTTSLLRKMARGYELHPKTEEAMQAADTALRILTASQ